MEIVHEDLPLQSTKISVHKTSQGPQVQGTEATANCNHDKDLSWQKRLSVGIGEDEGGFRNNHANVRTQGNNDNLLKKRWKYHSHPSTAIVWKGAQVDDRYIPRWQRHSHA